MSLILVVSLDEVRSLLLLLEDEAEDEEEEGAVVVDRFKAML